MKIQNSYCLGGEIFKAIMGQIDYDIENKIRYPIALNFYTSIRNVLLADITNTTHKLENNDNLFENIMKPNSSHENTIL